MPEAGAMEDGWTIEREGAMEMEMEMRIARRGEERRGRVWISRPPTFCLSVCLLLLLLGVAGVDGVGVF